PPTVATAALGAAASGARGTVDARSSPRLFPAATYRRITKAAAATTAAPSANRAPRPSARGTGGEALGSAARPDWLKPEPVGPFGPGLSDGWLEALQTHPGSGK